MSPRARFSASATAILACLVLAACGLGSDTPSNEELSTTDGFATALDALEAEEGGGDALAILRLQITERGAEFYVLGEQAQGYIYTNGVLQDTDFQVIGARGLTEQAFPLNEVDPEAVERLIDGAEEQTDGELRPIAITLERSPLDGELRWTLNAAGGVSFSAGADGSDPAPVAGAQEQGL